MPLNRANDGPFAFADANELNEIEATEYLIDAVSENAEINGGSMSDWGSAEDIMSVYVILDYDPDTNHPIETERDAGPRGKAILNYLIETNDEDGARKMLDDWTDELYGA